MFALLKRGSLTVLAVVACALCLSGTAFAATPWSGSGTGTPNLVSDGTSSPAEFSYAYTNPCPCGASGSWTFSTTSDITGSVDLSWAYTGFNAYFAVTVGVSAYVIHQGITTTTPLISAGPSNCCSAPSSGFSYSGTTSLQVAAGDTYGFRLTGSNGDSNATLNGTLTINSDVETSDPDPVAAAAQHVGYCAVAGDVDPDTGQPIAPGTFLVLNGGQPAVDPSYAGATPAVFLQGLGIACGVPVGYTLTSQTVGYGGAGDPGVYAYYAQTG
jgi:hypothetical protein